MQFTTNKLNQTINAFDNQTITPKQTHKQLLKTVRDIRTPNNEKINKIYSVCVKAERNFQETKKEDILLDAINKTKEIVQTIKI